MEENERGFSLSTLIGKLVLKCLAIIAILAAVKIVLEKVFHKSICLSVAVEDVKDDENEDGDEDEEEDEEDEEDEKEEASEKEKTEE